MSENSKKNRTKKSSAVNKKGEDKGLHDPHTNTSSTSTSRTSLSTKSEKKSKDKPPTTTKFDHTCSSIFFGYDLPNHVTEKHILSFLLEFKQSIVTVEIIRNRWNGNYAKILFATALDAHTAIEQYDSTYWEKFDIGVTLKPWKDKYTSHTTTSGAMVKATVQHDVEETRTEVDTESVSAANTGKSGKSVHRTNKMQVITSKKPAKPSFAIDSSERPYSKVYTIKLSGLTLNVKRKKIENLIKPFGDLANNVKISRYPQNNVCYAYVDFIQRSSAKNAVVKLDKFKLSGTKLHVCHTGELGVEHNCRCELEALNNPKDLTCDQNSSSKLPTISLETYTNTLPSDDLKVFEHREFEVSTTGEVADEEATNLKADLLSNRVDNIEGIPIIGCSEQECAKLYSIKLSGFTNDVHESEIVWLVTPFGDLTDPVEISQYPESNISYALVTYKHKNSAEKAVLKLDRSRFKNIVIHACHQGELWVAQHDCRSELIALNTPVYDEVANYVNSNSSDLLGVLKTKSVELKNHLALSTEMDFKNALRSVIVSSCDHEATCELHDPCSAQQCTTLKVTNLHPDIWFQDLENHFGSCHAPLLMHIDYYAYSSSVFICYASSDAARKVAQRFDGSELNGYQMHISQATYEAKSETSVTKIGAIKPIQDSYTPSVAEIKKNSGTSSKKRSLSLNRHQMLILITCIPNLVKHIKTSWNVTVTGFIEGSTCLSFKGDNFQIAYQYVTEQIGFCRSNKFHCNMDSSLLLVAIKSIKKMKISVVICNTGGQSLLPLLEDTAIVNTEILVIHSMFVNDIDNAINVLKSAPLNKQLKLPAQDVRCQLEDKIKEFQIRYQYLVCLQVLRREVVVQGYVEGDVIEAYKELKALIVELSKVTVEFSHSREEIQFLRYIMFYKPTEQAKTLLSHLSKSLSLNIQKSKTSFTLTGDPVATDKGLKCIEQQLLDNFQVGTFRFRCHSDFLQLIKESVKEPVERDLNVVIYYFSVNGSEQLDPVKGVSIMIYVKIYSTDSSDFKKACNIVQKLKPETYFYTMAEDEFEYIMNTEESVVDLAKIGESFRVKIELQHEKVALHAFTLREAKNCFHALSQNIFTALKLVSCIELTTLQLKYLLSNKSTLIKSLNMKFETPEDSSPALKLEGKRSQVEKNTQIIKELLNSIVIKSHKLTHNNYITMWEKCWQEKHDKIFQDNELYVELAISVFDHDIITCELVIAGENVQKVESAISSVIKLDGNIRECNLLTDEEGVKIIKDGLQNNKINVEKEIVYHIEIVLTSIKIVTPFHMSAEKVKDTVAAYIVTEKENLKFVRKSFEVKYSFFAKKLNSEWSTIQSIASGCEINMVTDSRCILEVKGKKVFVKQTEPQILQYILSLENDVTISILPVDYYSSPALKSSELVHLCKEVENEFCISLAVQVYPEVLSTAIVKWFNPSVAVQICEGSVCLDNSDTFVNFTDGNLTISQDLEAIIGDKAAVKNYVIGYGSQCAGKAVCPSIPGRSKRVIHAVMPNWVDGNSGEIGLITSAVIDSLELAVKYNAESVSFPFLSYTDKKLPTKVLAECCLLAVHNFCKKTNFVHRIRLILPASMAKAFNYEFATGLFQQFLVANSNNATVISGDSIWLWKDDFDKYQCYELGQMKTLDNESKINKTCSMTIGRFTYKIDFSAMTQTNLSTHKVRLIKHTISDRKWMFKNSCKNWEYFSIEDSMEIENMYINASDCTMVIAGEMHIICFPKMTLQNTRTNAITTIKRLSTNKSLLQLDKNNSNILILGLCADVDAAEVKVKCCIDSLCLIKSINIPQQVIQVLHAHLKRIERDHRVEICNTTTTTISKRYNVKGFKENVQEAVAAIYQTMAENSALQSLQYLSRPKEWEPQLKAIELMDVPQGSSEWNKILNRMQDTLPMVKLTSIQRIQNEYLWEKYCLHKQRIGRKGTERVNEKELFHGTSRTPPEKIYKSEEGFDMRYSQAGMWGQGNYFAESAKYSASSYAYRKETTHKYILGIFTRTTSEKQIFLAKVLTGDSYRSHPDRTLRFPPVKATSSSAETIHHDTVHGISQGGDLIYITYSNDKAYPMYLISFTD